MLSVCHRLTFTDCTQLSPTDSWDCHSLAEKLPVWSRKEDQSADTRQQNLILTEKESFIEAGKINTKGKDAN